MDNEKRILELLEIVDTHDCHMTSESGCQCEAIAQELSNLGFNISLPTEYPVGEPL